MLVTPLTKIIGYDLASLRKFIDNDKIKKTIEYFFALLLVLTGIYLAIN
jgi:threonine/homoserine/homoserine lactone efflux protein